VLGSPIYKTLNAELNIEDESGLYSYLLERGVIQKNTKVNFTLLSGGVSNRTVLIDFEDGSSWVMKQALAKLRVDGDWFCSPERIFYEAEAMRWLERYVPGNTPELVFEDRSEYILAMEAVQLPFENLKILLINSPPKSEYFTSAGKLLGHIHLQGSKEGNCIPELFNDVHFFHSLRIEPYYLETIKQVEDTGGFYKTLIDDTNKDRFTIVHGDYSPKNLLVKNHKLILLDHEVTHFGDGTFDLGFFMAHLLSKANHLPDHRREFLTGATQFFQAYNEVVNGLNKSREQRAVRHTIGCLLARVCGLSPLEYLSQEQRRTQKALALQLMKDIPRSINKMVSKFKDLIDARNKKD